jgi:hypothetical protein
MLASVVQFFRSPGDIPSEFEDYFDSTRYFVTSANTVILRWKVLGAMAVSTAGCLIYLLIILAHFDTICFPNFWVRLFQDGSLTERNLLILMVMFWVAGLTINTGSLSVGESQPNVFFTTWIAFCATANNWSMWRESAGLQSWFDNHPRETTRNWFWTAFFSLILGGSVLDLFLYRDEVTLQSNGQNLNVSETTWLIVLCLVWGEVFIIVVALVWADFVQVEPFALPCHCKERSGWCVFGWCDLEGLILVLLVGTKYYVVLKYTGVDSVVNGLTNSYLGVWGTFFSSTFGLGSWLKEAYFVSDDDGEEGRQGRPKP